MRPLIIGIAGGTGSGKTTLVENLKEQTSRSSSAQTSASCPTTTTTPPTTT